MKEIKGKLQDLEIVLPDSVYGKEVILSNYNYDLWILHELCGMDIDITIRFKDSNSNEG